MNPNFIQETHISPTYDEDKVTSFASIWNKLLQLVEAPPFSIISPLTSSTRSVTVAWKDYRFIFDANSKKTAERIMRQYLVENFFSECLDPAFVSTPSITTQKVTGKVSNFKPIVSEASFYNFNHWNQLGFEEPIYDVVESGPPHAKTFMTSYKGQFFKATTLKNLAQQVQQQACIDYVSNNGHTFPEFISAMTPERLMDDMLLFFSAFPELRLLLSRPHLFIDLEYLNDIIVDVAVLFRQNKDVVQTGRDCGYHRLTSQQRLEFLRLMKYMGANYEPSEDSYDYLSLLSSFPDLVVVVKGGSKDIVMLKNLGVGNRIIDIGAPKTIPTLDQYRLLPYSTKFLFGIYDRQNAHDPLSEVLFFDELVEKPLSLFTGPRVGGWTDQEFHLTPQWLKDAPRLPTKKHSSLTRSALNLGNRNLLVNSPPSDSSWCTVVALLTLRQIGHPAFIQLLRALTLTRTRAEFLNLLNQNWNGIKGAFTAQIAAANNVAARAWTRTYSATLLNHIERDLVNGDGLTMLDTYSLYALLNVSFCGPPLTDEVYYAGGTARLAHNVPQYDEVLYEYITRKFTTPSSAEIIIANQKGYPHSVSTTPIWWFGPNLDRNGDDIEEDKQGEEDGEEGEEEEKKGVHEQPGQQRQWQPRFVQQQPVNQPQAAPQLLQPPVPVQPQVAVIPQPPPLPIQLHPMPQQMPQNQPQLLPPPQPQPLLQMQPVAPQPIQPPPLPPALIPQIPLNQGPQIQPPVLQPLLQPQAQPNRLLANAPIARNMIQRRGSVGNLLQLPEQPAQLHVQAGRLILPPVPVRAGVALRILGNQPLVISENDATTISRFVAERAQHFVNKINLRPRLNKVDNTLPSATNSVLQANNSYYDELIRYRQQVDPMLELVHPVVRKQGISYINGLYDRYRIPIVPQGAVIPFVTTRAKLPHRHSSRFTGKKFTVGPVEQHMPNFDFTNPQHWVAIERQQKVILDCSLVLKMRTEFSSIVNSLMSEQLCHIPVNVLNNIPTYDYGHSGLRTIVDYFTAYILTKVNEFFIDLGSKYGKIARMTMMRFYAIRANIFAYDEAYWRNHPIQDYPHITFDPRPADGTTILPGGDLISIDCAFYYEGTVKCIYNHLQCYTTARCFVAFNAYTSTPKENGDYYMFDNEASFSVYRNEEGVLRIKMKPNDNTDAYEHDHFEFNPYKASSRKYRGLIITAIKMVKTGNHSAYIAAEVTIDKEWVDIGADEHYDQEDPNPYALGDLTLDPVDEKYLASALNYYTATTDLKDSHLDAAKNYVMLLNHIRAENASKATMELVTASVKQAHFQHHRDKQLHREEIDRQNAKPESSGIVVNISEFTSREWRNDIVEYFTPTEAKSVTHRLQTFMTQNHGKLWQESHRILHHFKRMGVWMFLYTLFFFLIATIKFGHGYTFFSPFTIILHLFVIMAPIGVARYFLHCHDTIRLSLSTLSSGLWTGYARYKYRSTFDILTLIVIVVLGIDFFYCLLSLLTTPLDHYMNLFSLCAHGVTIVIGSSAFYNIYKRMTKMMRPRYLGVTEKHSPVSYTVGNLHHIYLNGYQISGLPEIRDDVSYEYVGTRQGLWNIHLLWNVYFAFTTNLVLLTLIIALVLSTFLEGTLLKIGLETIVIFHLGTIFNWIFIPLLLVSVCLHPSWLANNIGDQLPRVKSTYKQINTQSKDRVGGHDLHQNPKFEPGDDSKAYTYLTERGNEVRTTKIIKDKNLLNKIMEKMDILHYKYLAPLTNKPSIATTNAPETFTFGGQMGYNRELWDRKICDVRERNITNANVSLVTPTYVNELMSGGVSQVAISPISCQEDTRLNHSVVKAIFYDRAGNNIPFEMLASSFSINESRGNKFQQTGVQIPTTDKIGPKVVQVSDAGLFKAFAGRQVHTLLKPSRDMVENFMSFCHVEIDKISQRPFVDYENYSLLPPPELYSTFDSWVQTYPLKQRNVYQRGYEKSLQTGRIISSFSVFQKSSEFHYLDEVIREMTATPNSNFTNNGNILRGGGLPVSSLKSRLICDPHCTGKAIPGWFNTNLMRWVLPRVPEIIFGLNSSQLERNLLKAYREVPNPTMVFMDGSSFDAHQHIDLIKAVDFQLMDIFGPEVLEKMNLSQVLVKELMAYAQKTKLKMKGYYLGKQRKKMFEATLAGTTFSGFNLRTTFGNSFRQMFYMKYVLHLAGITKPDYNLRVAGDDVMLIISKDKLQSFQDAFWDVYSKTTDDATYGLGQCAKMLTTSDHVLDFLSKTGVINFMGCIAHRAFLNATLSGNYSEKLSKKFTAPMHNYCITSGLEAWADASVPYVPTLVRYRKRHLNHATTVDNPINPYSLVAHARPSSDIVNFHEAYYVSNVAGALRQFNPDILTYGLIDQLGYANGPKTLK